MHRENWFLLRFRRQISMLLRNGSRESECGSTRTFQIVAPGFNPGRLAAMNDGRARLAAMNDGREL